MVLDSSLRYSRSAMVVNDIWSSNNLPRLVIDFLLPTGLMVTLEFARDVTLSQMKQQVWKEAERMPFSDSMSESCSSYHLMYINHRGEHEEMVDESKRLCDIRPFA